jgi:hypothetical protein
MVASKLSMKGKELSEWDETLAALYPNTYESTSDSELASEQREKSALSDEGPLLEGPN